MVGRWITNSPTTKLLSKVKFPKSRGKVTNKTKKLIKRKSSKSGNLSRLPQNLKSCRLSLSNKFSVLRIRRRNLTMQIIRKDLKMTNKNSTLKLPLLTQTQLPLHRCHSLSRYKCKLAKNFFKLCKVRSRHSKTKMVAVTTKIKEIKTLDKIKICKNKRQMTFLRMINLTIYKASLIQSNHSHSLEIVEVKQLREAAREHNSNLLQDTNQSVWRQSNRKLKQLSCQCKN